MPNITAADRLRIAVALCALKLKPEGQAIESYTIDLKEAARVGNTSQGTEWRALAISLESQIRQLRADELHRDDKAKQQSQLPYKLIPLPPATSDLPSILSHGLSLSLHSPPKLDVLRSRLVPEMAWALFEGILRPAISFFFPLSVEVFASKAPCPDSRPFLLHLVQASMALVAPDVRKQTGMFAIDTLSDLTGENRLARKDSLWYLCSIVNIAGVGQSGVQRLCKLLHEEALSLVEKEMIEAVLERIWLSVDAGDDG